MSAKTKNKSDIILFSVAAVLLVFYIISFTKSCSSTDKREIVKTALVNKKYKDEINQFQLQSMGQLITLSKLDGRWYIIPGDNTEISMPADETKINRFIDDLVTVQDLYKLGDNSSKNNSFGFSEPSAFNIRYYYGENGDFKDIIFGNQDFALSSRYMMSGKSTTVYEIGSTFDIYLTTNVQSWTEPYIISQQFLGNIKADDIQRCLVTYDGTTAAVNFDSKLLELRHGGFPTTRYFSFEMFDNPLMEIKLELGNKNNIVLKICQSGKSDEQEYFIETEYRNESSNTNYVSYSKISGWTYNKITEIML